MVADLVARPAPGPVWNIDEPEPYGSVVGYVNPASTLADCLHNDLLCYRKRAVECDEAMRRAVNLMTSGDYWAEEDLLRECMLRRELRTLITELEDLERMAKKTGSGEGV